MAHVSRGRVVGWPQFSISNPGRMWPSGGGADLGANAAHWTGLLNSGSLQTDGRESAGGTGWTDAEQQCMSPAEAGHGQGKGECGGSWPPQQVAFSTGRPAGFPSTRGGRQHLLSPTHCATRARQVLPLAAGGHSNCQPQNKNLLIWPPFFFFFFVIGY